MRSAFVCLCFILSAHHPLQAQSWRDNRARLCFDRPEDNGAINMLPSWVRIRGYDLPLVGGQAACVFLQPDGALRPNSLSEPLTPPP